MSRGLLENTLEKVLLGEALLVGRDVGPVLLSYADRLDGGKLADATVVVGDGDLDQEQQRLWLGEEVLLELSGNRLDMLGVGCNKHASQYTSIHAVVQ